MKKQYALNIIFLFLFFKTLAQPIGINTSLPASDLHVNGNMTFSNELSVGGNSSSKGNPGQEGQVLSSKGANNTPEWVTLNIPKIVPGALSLTKSLVQVDTKGVKIVTNPNNTIFKENEDLILTGNNRWYQFTELTSTIKIVDPINKINFTIQTIAHMKPANSVSSKISFAIGVFINDKLKAVRPFFVQGNSSSFSIPTMISTIENLPIGDYTIKIAAIPRIRENYTSDLTIGIPNTPESDNISPFMAKTSLKIEVFELLNK
ncbi:hypothetical protein LNQ81_16225 [Myroides sp. M-43]|uniref:hypothetical protein n=1 Tax=Myroides oncorhynchi TaxID=2893756 RepID=UPI001E60C7B1|nr:hypothetical protein [Myroides oncorhynchi]MCC9044219.1 hypothetical protein [Myroides oncorhynchi]